MKEKVIKKRLLAVIFILIILLFACNQFQSGSSDREKNNVNKNQSNEYYNHVRELLDFFPVSSKYDTVILIDEYTCSYKGWRKIKPELYSFIIKYGLCTQSLSDTMYYDYYAINRLELSDTKTGLIIRQCDTDSASDRSIYYLLLCDNITFRTDKNILIAGVYYSGDWYIKTSTWLTDADHDGQKDMIMKKYTLEPSMEWEPTSKLSTALHEDSIYFHKNEAGLFKKKYAMAIKDSMVKNANDTTYRKIRNIYTDTVFYDNTYRIMIDFSKYINYNPRF